MRQAKIEEQYFTTDQFETDYVLPEGWAAAILEELIGRGGILTDGDWIESKDQDPHGDVRLIQLADIGGGYYKDKSSRFLTSEKAKELGCTFLEKGDVLIARMPEPLGRTCIFPGDPKPAVTAVDICIIRTGDDGADHRWIMHTVNSPEIRRRIESLQKGTTRKRISRRNLASLTLPTPPFNEQRRIAVKVEELLARVNATKDRLAKVSMILKRFRQAVLAAACSGRLTSDWREKQSYIQHAKDLLLSILAERRQFMQESNPKKRGAPESLHPYREAWDVDPSEFEELPDGWVWASGEDLFAWSSGDFLPKKKQEKGPYPIYGGNGITGYHSEYLVDHPTLVIGRVGALCGNVYITSDKAWITDNAIYASYVPTKLNLQYVKMVFTQSNLNANAGGSGQPFVNQTVLNKVAFPLPPLAEQHEIVRRVESMFKLADAVEKRVVAATMRAEKLTQAILSKAFRGELVPTEAELARHERSSYESASDLLARIKSDRQFKRGQGGINRIRDPQKK